MCLAQNIWLMTSYRSSFMIAKLCELKLSPIPPFPGAFFLPPACIPWCISVGSKDDSSVPPYEVCRSQRITPINFFKVASLPLLFFFYFRCRIAGYKSVFGRSCDQEFRHRFVLVSLCLKQMLRWFPRLQVLTTCSSCSPTDLNLVVNNFTFCIRVK